jgi:hypothetical protein
VLGAVALLVVMYQALKHLSLELHIRQQLVEVVLVLDHHKQTETTDQIPV